MIDAVERIKTERERQVWSEGWTPAHDDEHTNGELAKAAVCYIEHATTVPYRDNYQAYKNTPPPPSWPWESNWWKPKQPQHDLIKAAALIAAEVDRTERAMIERIAKDLG